MKKASLIIAMASLWGLASWVHRAEGAPKDDIRMSLPTPSQDPQVPPLGPPPKDDPIPTIPQEISGNPQDIPWKMPSLGKLIRDSADDADLVFRGVITNIKGTSLSNGS